MKWLAAPLLLTACAGTPPPEASDRFCATRIERVSLPIPQPRPGQIEALRAQGFSEDATETAEAIGALEALQALTARRDPLGALLAREDLRDRVLLAMLDVQTTLAAIDCEGERGLQLRGQVQRIEARRVRNLSLAGILVGAGTAVVSGALSLGALSMVADIVGISGGALEGAVAGSLLFGGPHGRLETRFNLIGEVWRQPASSTLFPPTVWRYLTRRDAPGQPSIADEIIVEWRATGVIAEDGPGVLLRGEGRFSIEELERRDAMMDLIEVRVALMNRDLRLLLAEIVARPQPRRGKGP